MLIATAALALFDAAFLLADPATRGPGLGMHIAYAAGHRAFLTAAALSLAGLFRLWAHKLPWWAGAPLTFVATVPLAFLALEEDLIAFELPSRVGVAALVAALPALLALLAARAPLRWYMRLGCVLLGLSLAIANQTQLKLNYPGFHLACVALSSLALGTAVVALPAGARPRLAEWTSLPRDGVVALFGAWSVVIPPQDSVAVRLATDDAAPLYRFASELYLDDDDGAADVGNNPFFKRRDKASPVPPGPALVPREDLLVVLITIDALRFDVANGERGGSLPTLQALRDDSVYFTQAYAPATSTSGTMSALFSGRYYSQVQWERTKVQDRFDYLPVETDTLRFPGLLSDAGVGTFLSPSHWRVSQWGRMVSGFQEEHRPKVTGYRKATEVLPPVTSWLKKRKAGPAFAYCHLIDAHAPYDDGGKGGTQFERYLREIGFADRALGELIAALKGAGLWSRTVLIVSADHGESFGEHGQKFHGGFAFQEQLHVPLYVRVPGLPSRVVDQPVSLIDLGPTILDLFGLPTPGSFMGESLVPVLRGESHTFLRPVAFHTTNRQFGFVYPDLIKVLYSPKRRRTEVYDLNADPQEAENLSEASWARERVALVRAFFRTHELRIPGYKIPTR